MTVTDEPTMEEDPVPESERTEGGSQTTGATPSTMTGSTGGPTTYLTKWSQLTPLATVASFYDRLPNDPASMWQTVLAGVDPNIIKLIGRWRSDAMFRYLHAQVLPLVGPLAQRMYRHGEYSLLPGGLTPLEAQHILRNANLADATFTPAPGEDLDDDDDDVDYAGNPPFVPHAPLVGLAH